MLCCTIFQIVYSFFAHPVFLSDLPGSSQGQTAFCFRNPNRFSGSARGKERTSLYIVQLQQQKQSTIAQQGHMELNILFLMLIFEL